MIRQHLLKNREKILPEVVDWTDPHNHLRFETNVKKMTQNDWFWFHPTSYVMFYFSPPIITGLILLSGAIYLMFNEQYGIAAFIGLLFGMMVYDFVKKWKQRSMIKNMNMYDLYLRDFIVGEKVK